MTNPTLYGVDVARILSAALTSCNTTLDDRYYAIEVADEGDGYSDVTVWTDAETRPGSMEIGVTVRVTIGALP